MRHSLLMLLGCLLPLVAIFLGGAMVYHGGAGVEPELLVEPLRHGHGHSGANHSPPTGHSHD